MNAQKSSLFPSSGDKGSGWPFQDDSLPIEYDAEIKWPKISIVTPSYNQGTFIEETIRSVLLQKYPNLEYIIIDGGSTDNTVEIIRKYENYLTYWVSEEDRGQSHAINKGLEKCSGDVFNWINSDDLYLPGAFKSLAELFLEHKEVSCVSGREVRFYPNGKTFVSGGSGIKAGLEETVFARHIDQPPTFFLLNQLKPFLPLSENLNFTMDADMWVKYLLKNGSSAIYMTSEVFNKFRIHDNSKTGLGFDRFENELDLILTRILQAINTPAEVFELWISLRSINLSHPYLNEGPVQINKNNFNEKRFLKFLNKKLAFLLYINKNYKAARQLLKNTWFFKPLDQKFTVLKLKLLLPDVVIDWLRGHS